MVAEQSTIVNMSGSFKIPPKFEDDSSYEAWKRDVEIWGKLTDLPVKKQALAIHLSLSGRARIASSEVEISVLESERGVEKLMEKLM